MADLYLDGGCAEIAAYSCDNCPTPEFGRIQAFAFIHESILATIIAAPTTTNNWTTAITDQTILMIPKSSGSYDGGSPTYGSGYGKQLQRLLGSDHKAQIKDPNYLANEAFYASLEISSGWHLCMLTSSKIHISGQPVSLFAKKVIADDLKSEVVGELEVAWFEKAGQKTLAYTAPNAVFYC